MESLLSGTATTSQGTLDIFGTDKTIVFDPAAHAIEAVFAQCFNPYHTDPAENWPRSISAVWVMDGDAKGAFPDLTWYKCSFRLTVEPITAQVVSHGLNDLGSTGPNEANRPVDLNPVTSATLSYNRIDFVNLMRAPEGRETVDRFRQHKRVPAAREHFPGHKQTGKNVENPHLTNYLHEFSMFLSAL